MFKGLHFWVCDVANPFCHSTTTQNVVPFSSRFQHPILSCWIFRLGKGLSAPSTAKSITGSPPWLLPPSPLEANCHAKFRDPTDEVIVHHPLVCQHIERAIDGIVKPCATQANILWQKDMTTNLSSCGVWLSTEKGGDGCRQATIGMHLPWASEEREGGVHITNPDMDCIKLEIATFKFGDQMSER